MNTSNNKCSACGDGLPQNHQGPTCSKCLLQVGLENTVDFLVDREANTIPPSDEQPSNVPNAAHSLWANTDASNDGEGIGVYRNLVAVRDWSRGTIYIAFHPGLERRVLLRVLENSNESPAHDELLRRAEILSRLNHPNTVATLEAGLSDGVVFVAEELVEGNPLDGLQPRTIRERWREGFYPVRKISDAMRDAALGLQAIHELGLTHGRLNPDNLLVDRNGMIRIVGLEEDADASDDRFARPSGNASKSIDDDIYRLGATFCFLATRRLPIELDPTLSARVLVRKLQKHNPGLPKDFCIIISRCLDPRSQAYENANAIACDLEQLHSRRVARATWRRRTYSGLLELLGLAILIGLIRSQLISVNVPRAEQASPLFLIALLGIPYLYFTILETFLGATLVRRFFGLVLLSHAGEKRPLWKRTLRAHLKLLVLAILFMVPAIVLPLITQVTIPPIIWGILALLWMLSPFYVMYLSAYWIPSRWTFYDLGAGVTWGELLAADAEPDIRRVTEVEAPPATAVVDRVDQYDIHEMLGSGGMGAVYRAFDRVLNRDVAIKVLASHLEGDPLLLERFQREARLAAKVSHSNVAKVFGNGIWNETPYIAMEFVPGRDLQELIRAEGQISLKDAWDYAIQAAEALHAAEICGVVHRDIKPANLIVAKNGHLKVTDFGVSRQTHVDTSSTEVGTIVGTPAYMAPEQAMGKEVDSRSDIYALGMTLYHMLAGHPPFKGSNAVELLAQQMGETPPSLTGKLSALTPAQNDLIMKMIAKKPTERFSGCANLLAALRNQAPGINRLASPLKRLAAEFCNWAAFWLLLMFGVTLFGLIAYSLRDTFEITDSMVGWAVPIPPLLFATGHIFATRRSGSTSGKKLLGLKVERLDGTRVSLFRAALRFATAYPLILVMEVLIVGGLIKGSQLPFAQIILMSTLVIQFSIFLASAVLLWKHPRLQTLHDLVTGTVVVRIQQ